MTLPAAGYFSNAARTQGELKQALEDQRDVIATNVAVGDNINWTGAHTWANAAGLSLKPHGASAGNTTELRFLELAANGANYVGFKSADALAASLIWTLPDADATAAGQPLVSNAAGVLSFGSTVQLGKISTTTGSLDLAHASSTHLTKLRAGNATAAVTYVLPTADGTSGYVLSTNGSGVLSWVAGGSGVALGDSPTWTGLHTWNSANTHIMRRDGAAVQIPLDLRNLNTAGGATDEGAGILLSGGAGQNMASFQALWTGNATTDAKFIIGVRRSSAMTYIATFADGMQVGAPTGGDRGSGTANFAGDIYKNNVAYTSPDYVLEHWATGRIVRFADREGADRYFGRRSLSDVEGFARAHYALPLIHEAREAALGGLGLFGGGDALLATVEETYLHLFDHERRLRGLEGRS